MRLLWPSLGYGSREQERGEPVDVRSDVFSLGACIYRLATDRFPYSDSFRKKSDPPLPLPFESHDLPPWQDLHTTLLTALQVHPDDRFPDVIAMLTELQKRRRDLDVRNRTLHFFDTSTLTELVSPPEPGPTGRKRAVR